MYKGGTVYIMSSPDKTTLYTGVTSDLIGRVWEHKSHHYQGSFSAKYKCTMLVYYKRFDGIEDAIEEEKRIKGGSRAKKEALINAANPEWLDLSDSIEY
jgi:Predicted endonuclease containing a URI domain